MCKRVAATQSGPSKSLESYPKTPALRCCSADSSALNHATRAALNQQLPSDRLVGCLSALGRQSSSLRGGLILCGSVGRPVGSHQGVSNTLSASSSGSSQLLSVNPRCSTAACSLSYMYGWMHTPQVSVPTQRPICMFCRPRRNRVNQKESWYTSSCHGRDSPSSARSSVLSPALGRHHCPETRTLPVSQANSSHSPISNSTTNTACVPQLFSSHRSHAQLAA